MEEKISQLNKYFYELIGEQPENLEEIKGSKNYMSLRKLSTEFNVSRHWLSNWLRNFLKKEFGQKALDIYSYLWPSSNQQIGSKKDMFLTIIKEQLENYPKNIDRIDSLHTYSSNFEVSRKSITKWLKKYLFNTYGLENYQVIYNKIWNRKHQKNNISYNLIRNIIKDRGEMIITSKDEFISMLESPTKRYINLMCEKGHLWNVRVNSILYFNVSCSMCNDLKSENSMRFHMENIFGMKFPKTTLNTAYQIPGKDGGKLQFDGYNSNIIVNSITFKIAFEYDGIQHDEFPNGFHKTEEEFIIQRKNDRRKDNLAQKNNTILIRLKEYNGFTYKNREIFPNEIFRLFQLKSGLINPELNLN